MHHQSVVTGCFQHLGRLKHCFQYSVASANGLRSSHHIFHIHLARGQGHEWAMKEKQGRCYSVEPKHSKSDCSGFGFALLRPIHSQQVEYSICKQNECIVVNGFKTDISLVPV